MIQIIQKFVTAVCATLSTLITVNVLGTSFFGAYVFAFTILAPLFPFASLGVKNYITVKFSHDRETIYYFKLGLLCELIGSALLLLILVLIILCMPQASFTNYALICLWLANVFNCCEVYESFLIATQRFKLLAYIEIFVSVITLSARAFLFKEPALIVASVVFESFLRSILFLISYCHHSFPSQIERKVRIEDIVSTGKITMPLAASNVISSYSFKLPIIIAGAFGFFNAVAIYTLLAKVPENLSVLLNILQQRLHRSFSRKHLYTDYSRKSNGLRTRNRINIEFLHHFTTHCLFLSAISLITIPAYYYILFRNLGPLPMTYLLLPLPILIHSALEYASEPVSVLCNRVSSKLVKNLLLILASPLISFVLFQLISYNHLFAIALAYIAISTLDAALSIRLIYSRDSSIIDLFSFKTISAYSKIYFIRLSSLNQKSVLT
jgi:hypothetical protein